MTTSFRLYEYINALETLVEKPMIIFLTHYFIDSTNEKSTTRLNMIFMYLGSCNQLNHGLRK